MSDERQPRAEWIFPEQKKSNKGRIWLIVGVSVLALAIVAALLYFLLPQGDEQNPESTPSPSPSHSATTTPTPSASVAPTQTPIPPPTTPVTEAPAPADPELGVFREKVGYLLSDADTGLGFVTGTSGTDAVGIIDQLLQDAQRLSAAQAPTSIRTDWATGVDEYATVLQQMRADAAAGGSPDTTDASEKVAVIKGLVGE